jgi:RNA polymerase sigma factor for flagellar operon FliA
MTDEATELWHALRAAREAPIRHYAPLVHDVAGDVARKLQPSVAGHDLVSYGMFGLIEAVGTYVPGPHGNRFEAYATPRIEAAILNELQQD